MKKWLIFAVIAAMVLMAFPSCGGDEEAGEPVADGINARVYNSGANVLIEWDGDGNTDYSVYSETLDYPVANGQVTLEIAGQRLFKYLDDDGNFVAAGLTNPDGSEGKWSAVVSAPGSGTVRYRVAVSNAGGSPLEQFTIKWDTGTITADDVAAGGHGESEKDNGYITF
jgi:hypothetical protein